MKNDDTIFDWHQKNEFKCKGPILMKKTLIYGYDSSMRLLLEMDSLEIVENTMNFLLKMLKKMINDDSILLGLNEE